jgi:aconitate hydratase
MVEIEPTLRGVLSVYGRMEERLRIVRSRLGRPLSLAEKLLFGHLQDPAGQELLPGKAELALLPDRVILQDVLGQTAMLQFAQTGRASVAVPTTVHCDHLVQARVSAASDLEASLQEDGEVYTFLRAAAARYGAGFWAPGAGIIHQVVLESYAWPGQLLVGTDSHTPNAGGLGACAVGVGGAEAVEVMAGLPWELVHPRRIGVVLTGQLRGWTAPKDVILALLGQLTTSGGTHAVLEYLGPGVRSLSATGRATITNMGAELGATTSIFPADEATLRYLQATGRGHLLPAIEAHRGLLQADPEVELEPERFFERVIHLDLDALEPHVVGPHSPDRARPISALAAEVRASEGALCDHVSAALIGSCTNSSYEDMTRAAEVAAQATAAGLRLPIPLLVTPGSERVRATLQRDGQLEKLEVVGASVLANACGPCIGQWRRPMQGGGGPNTILTSYNRNFAGRNDGHAATQSFIASPELVLALALAGRLSFNPLTDTLLDSEGRPFRLSPPRPAPDVPPGGFLQGRSFYVAPPVFRGPAPVLDPLSERLSPMRPWPAWDGQDLCEMPVLIKARGKTTTDQISPAGVWLRYRGHLERFSDNLLSGAVDAFTGEVGQTVDIYTKDRGPVARVARAYRSRGQRFVIVGDHNYGEGSSREHAALSPRLLGGAAVIARSFARIHEKNLKKQGLLALTFRDPADYEHIGPHDRVSLLGLAALAEGEPVLALLLHEDGSRSELLLQHTYTTAQLAWFRAGSALQVAGGSSQGM